MNREGWLQTPSQRKFHYYRDRRSLCGRYGIFGTEPLEADNGQVSKDDCAACRTKLDKEKKQ